VAPRTSLDDVKERKFLTLSRLELHNFGRPAHVADHNGRTVYRGPYTYESGSGAGFGLISRQTHELTPNFATHTRTSLAHWNPSRVGLASQTRTCMGSLRRVLSSLYRPLKS
jgi:hypothetical protein